MTDRARFESHVAFEPMSGCWLWEGSLDRDGYSRVHYQGKTIRAYRASWQIYRGRIRRGQEIDHTCTNRACVNPDHLQQVSRCHNVHLIHTRRRLREASHG